MAPRAEDAPAGVPQLWQNFAPAGRFVPQEAHGCSPSGAPQDAQNLPLAGVPHRGQEFAELAVMQLSQERVAGRKCIRAGSDCGSRGKRWVAASNQRGVAAELVTHPANGVNQIKVSHPAQLAAQVRDMHIHHVRFGIE